MRLTLLLTLIAGFATPAFAQDPGMPAPIAHSAEHDHLKAMAGKWKVAMTMHAPDGSTMKSEGTHVASLTMDGLGLIFDHQSPMGPGKMIGHGFLTWIPGKQKFQSIWMDNMSHNGMATGWATWDAAKKTMTEIMTGPGPDGTDMTFTIITVAASPDTHTSTFMMKGPDGKEFPMMEMVYTRQKG